MKQAQFSINFKTTTNAAGEKVKRDTLVINYGQIEAADIENLDSTQIAVVLNDSIQNYARKLVTANSDNWDYVPSIDDLNIAAVYDDLTSPSKRGQRLITKAKLAEFAAYYSEQAIIMLGKSVKAANSGASVIANKLVPLVGKDDAIEVFENNLAQMIAHDEFDMDQFGDLASALIDLIQEIKTPAISADDL